MAQRKTARVEKRCTCCGEDLPRYRTCWGLVWDDQKTGMCKTCLITIRKSIGYYTEDNPAPPLPRKRKRKSKAQGSS
jgi:hypothetical protein